MGKSGAADFSAGLGLTNKRHLAPIAIGIPVASIACPSMIFSRLRSVQVRIGYVTSIFFPFSCRI
jgi:hypothetical protein